MLYGSGLDWLHGFCCTCTGFVSRRDVFQLAVAAEAARMPDMPMELSFKRRP